MKNNILESVLLPKKFNFVKNFNVFAQKVCQNLPFSNILLISFDNDFFSFGYQIEQNLFSFGARVKSVIIKRDNLAELDDFLKEKSLVLEFRSIIIFNKKVLSHLNSFTKYSLPKIFYLQLTSDIYGTFESVAQIEHYFCTSEIDKTHILKTFSVRTLTLIDYIFCNNLIKSPLDLNFFQKVKRQLISALVCGESISIENFFKRLIVLEMSFNTKAECKNFSASVVCELMQKSPCDLQTIFIASKQIIKRYKQVLANRFTAKLSFSDRARLISFYSGKSLNKTLSGLYQQMLKIGGEINDGDIKEIKSLIKVFDKFVCKIESVKDAKPESDKQSRFLENKLQACIDVCGDTSFSINGMSFCRQKA